MGQDLRGAQDEAQAVGHGRDIGHKHYEAHLGGGATRVSGYHHARLYWVHLEQGLGNILSVLHSRC